MRFMSRMVLLLAGLVLLAVATGARAQEETKARTEIYGFVQTDAGYWTKPVNPDWFDVQRPTKLPSFENEFGKDGNVYFSVRQTRFGVKSFIPTKKGEFKTTFEFDMFGVGADAGQTTIRPRVFYGELGKLGVGQINSTFMDGDVFPNCLDYWGPNGMLFYRNVQIRYMPIQGEKKSLTVALERPGASGDAGVYADRIQLAGVTPNFPLPDLSANYRMGQKWGHLQIAGIVRDIEWQGTGATADSISGSVTGWGASLSGVLKPGTSDVIRAQFTYGEGVQNYFNDAPVDVGIETTSTGAEAVALPITGVSIFDDHTWNDRWTSTFGYSQVDIENSSGQLPDAYHLGQYALANLLYSPDSKLMMGVEVGWERRENNSDGFSTEDWRIATSFKYSFSGTIGGGK